MKFSIRTIELPLKVNWKISRGETLCKTNLIIETDYKIGIMGEVAPNIRYDEDVDKITYQFQTYFSENFSSVEQVRQVLKQNPICHSLKFGMDQVLIAIEMEEHQKSFGELFNISEAQQGITSYSIPIMDPALIADYIKSNSAFRHLKLKVEHEGALELIDEVFKTFKGILRVDANEAWKDLDQFLKFQEKIKHYPIEFIEQPFPAVLEDEYKALKPKSVFPIMADESIEDRADFSELKDMFHMVNIKLMKTGSVANAIHLIKSAKKHKMKVMLGCMIESSLGISFGLRLAKMTDYLDLDGFLLLKEDPFKLIELKGDILYLQS